MNEDDHKTITIQHAEILKKHDGIISDHEKRVRWLEKIAFYAIAGLLVAKFLWDIYQRGSLK
jgi:hypothetical protein